MVVAEQYDNLQGTPQDNADHPVNSSPTYTAQTVNRVGKSDDLRAGTYTMDTSGSAWAGNRQVNADSNYEHSRARMQEADRLNKMTNGGIQRTQTRNADDIVDAFRKR